MNRSSMSTDGLPRSTTTISDPEETDNHQLPVGPACAVCGAKLIEIRAKLQCVRCRAICETCCEGARW